MKSFILIGMPGSGKTTLGRKVAENMGYEFIDLDDEITKRHGDITGIFTNEGEEAFRIYETEALSNAINNPGAVISTGGGIVEKELNRELIKEHLVLFIDRTLKNIYSTLDSESRPLLKGKREVLKELYERRYPKYVKAADFVIDNNGSFNDCISNIENIIKQG
jgi:shikimate kinase